jgi:F0F1-type ATP synthase delta subunit
MLPILIGIFTTYRFEMSRALCRLSSHSANCSNVTAAIRIREESSVELEKRVEVLEALCANLAGSQSALVAFLKVVILTTRREDIVEAFAQALEQNAAYVLNQPIEEGVLNEIELERRKTARILTNALTKVALPFPSAGATIR